MNASTQYTFTEVIDIVNTTTSKTYKLKTSQTLRNQFLSLFSYMRRLAIYLMLWSQIIYGHRTASISPKIVRFYGARTVPGRRQEESYDFLSFF